MFHVPDGLAEDYAKSWRWMVEFYDDLRPHPGWQFTEPLRRLVHAVAGSEWARCFRAGQSLHRLMVSTAPVHGLHDGDPFVSADVHGGNRIRLAYSYIGGGGEAIETRDCDEADALAELTYLLTRLGNDPNGHVARERR
jgi:hypothetical protein